MMKKLFILFFLFCGISFGQYSVRSHYLKDPKNVIGYVDSCAKFWLKAYDSNNGGFFTNINRTGGIAWNRNKDMMSQARDAYGFTRAYMLTGNRQYLEMARRALDFMYAHAWDKTNGGWFNEMSETGAPLNAQSNKTAFNQHYALLGSSAYFEATGDSLDWNWLMKGYSNNESRLWDNRAGFEGYFDQATANWGIKDGKSFNATVDAITTHALYLYLMTKDEKYLSKMLKIADDNIMKFLVPSMDNQKIGFAEVYNSQWGVNTNETMTIMGHVLKTAWCLGRIHQLSPNEKYVEAGKKLVQNVLDKGYDHQYGGPYKDFNRVTGQMLMWGADTAKAWWQMEQAIMAGLEMYDITQDSRYLKMADESLDFYMKYFVDHQYGDVYTDRLKKGGAVPGWGDGKGSGTKAAYHSVETGYYVYLYGNLFFKNEPVTLYYNFQPAAAERNISLYPLAIADNRLKILSVIKDGTDYKNFSAENRTVNIPAGEGGEYKVTFVRGDYTGVLADNDGKPTDFALDQNYPNPFNPSTTIGYQLAQSSEVELKVFDILGREVATLVKGLMPAGSHSAVFSAGDLSSGIYLYRLKAGNSVITRKMVYMR